MKLQCTMFSLMLSAGVSCSAEASVSPSLWPTAWSSAADAARLDPALLYATALVNSGVETNGRLTVWPWTVRIDGKARRFSGAGPAAAAANWATRKGKDVALGLFALRLPPDAVIRTFLKEDVQLGAGAEQIAECLHGTEDKAVALGRCLDPTTSRADAAELGRRILSTRTKLIGGRSSTLEGVCHLPTGGPKRAIAEKIIEAAFRHDIDPAFALGIARSESALRHQGIRSPAGAIGVMQLMPATARRFNANPYDLDDNIEAGVRYLRTLADRFDNVPALVAASYNAGEGAVEKYNRTIPPYRETRAYVPRVLDARRTYACQ